MRMSDMSAQMKDMRSQMEENEQLSVLMAGLRGSNTNDDDWAGKDVVMQLISVSDADGEVRGRPLSASRSVQACRSRPSASALGSAEARVPSAVEG